MHVRDVMAEDAYLARRDSGAVAAVELGGARTVLSVPLLDEGEMTGAFFLWRQRVQSFTDKQIKLVQHFATQAVVAIENARLLNQLRDELPTDRSIRTEKPSRACYRAQPLGGKSVPNFSPYLRMQSIFAGHTSAICSFTRMAHFVALRCSMHRNHT